MEIAEITRREGMKIRTVYLIRNMVEIRVSRWNSRCVHSLGGALLERESPLERFTSLENRDGSSKKKRIFQNHRCEKIEQLRPFPERFFSTVRNFHRRPMFSRIIGGRKSWREIETDREEKYRPLSSILLRTLDSGWWGKDACRTNWKLIAGINVALFTVGGAILHVVRTCRDIIGRRCDVAARWILSSGASLLVLLQRVAKPRQFISRELPLDSNRRVVVVVAIRRLNFVDKRFDGLLFEHRTASKLQSKPLSRRSIALDNSEAVDCSHLFEL